MAAASAAIWAVNCWTLERWVSSCCRVANSPSLMITLQVQIDIGEIGLVLLLLGLGLIERCLVRARIDLGEQVALVDQLAFVEGNLVDLAVDAGAHDDRVEGLNGSKAGQVDRKVGFLDRGDGDPYRVAGGLLRVICCGRLILTVKSLPAEIAQPERRPRQQNPTRCPRFVHVGPSDSKKYK